jgi:FMN phosphatase YigB (HAD superfamily)
MIMVSAVVEKPATGLFEKAFRDFAKTNPGNSVMIGDSGSDILAGATLGMKTILIAERPNPREGWDALPNAWCHSLFEAVETYLS